MMRTSDLNCSEINQLQPGCAQISSEMQYKTLPFLQQPPQGCSALNCYTVSFSAVRLFSCSWGYQGHTHFYFPSAGWIRGLLPWWPQMIKNCAWWGRERWVHLLAWEYLLEECTATICVFGLRTPTDTGACESHRGSHRWIRNPRAFPLSFLPWRARWNTCKEPDCHGDSSRCGFASWVRKTPGEQLTQYSCLENHGL